jgi:Icc-related predicted phosphoesterase
MKKLIIAHLSDTHGLHWRMPAIPAVKQPIDVIVHSGDMTNVGGKSDVQSFLDWFVNLPAAYKVFIPGNHDLCFDPERNGTKGHYEFMDWPGWLMDEIDNFTKSENHFFLNNSSCTIKGVKFWGSPITPWFHGEHWAFNKRRGEEIAEVWKGIDLDTNVLITHGPCAHQGDFTHYTKEYVGCEELTKRIKQIEPLLHLFGHIHEGYGWTYNQYSNYFNGCICNLNYDPIREPWIIDANFDEKEVNILNETLKRTV